MEELFRKIEDRLITHLWDVEHDLEEENGFTCPQQLDDIRDCVSTIKDIHKVLAMYAK